MKRALTLWLIVQGLLMGFKWPIQYITAVNGLLIVALALVPSVREFYATQHPPGEVARAQPLSFEEATRERTPHNR